MSCSDNDSTCTSRSGRRSEELGNEGSDHVAGEGGFPMEVIPETRVDLPEEVAESSLPAKVRYE